MLDFLNRAWYMYISTFCIHRFSLGLAAGELSENLKGRGGRKVKSAPLGADGTWSPGSDVAG